MFNALLREYAEFFFKKGLAVELTIAMVIGQQFNVVAHTLTNDLLMPLLMPLIHVGNWQEWSIMYFGNTIAIGKITDMSLNTVLTGFVLFLLLKSLRGSARNLDGPQERARVQPKGQA